jgi:hypothetical protein
LADHKPVGFEGIRKSALLRTDDMEEIASYRKGKDGERLCVLQDGVECPRQAPWKKTYSAAGIPGLILIALGVYILAKTSIAWLMIWGLIVFLFAYPLRYLICARCPYYGQQCWSGLGVAVTFMFKKQEGKSMMLGLWLDVVLGLIIFAIPLVLAVRYLAPAMTMVWCGAFLLMVGVMTRAGCASCPFTFCPIGKLGKRLWGDLR